MKIVRTSSTVHPRLLALPVREPPVRASDRDVHDEIERLIERRNVGRPALPRVLEVDEVRPVRDDGRELAALEEGLVETEIHHVGQARVNVDAHELLVPLERVRVEVVRERLAPVRPPPERLADPVQPRERAPVERPAHVVDAPVRAGVGQRLSLWPHHGDHDGTGTHCA